MWSVVGSNQRGPEVENARSNEPAPRPPAPNEEIHAQAARVGWCLYSSRPHARSTSSSETRTPISTIPSGHICTARLARVLATSPPPRGISARYHSSTARYGPKPSSGRRCPSNGREAGTATHDARGGAHAPNLRV